MRSWRAMYVMCWVAVGCVGWGEVQGESGRAKVEKPNVVFILADDLGYADLACTGSDLYQTPNIDGIASRGQRFSQAYSSHPTCSPSRSAILSGKYPARLGIVSHGGLGTVSEGDGTFLVPSEYTLAEAMRDGGYVTCHVGKWHVGKDGYAGPREQGFEYDIASNQFCCPGSFKFPYIEKHDDPDRVEISAIPDLADRGPGDHLTVALGEEAAAFIGEHKDEPFFLYLSYYAVHTPIWALPEKVAKYKALKRSGLRHRNVNYAGLVEHLDDSVGLVLEALEDHGLSDRTIVIFFSDNGGANYSGITSNHPMREGKVTQYMGGVRVPLFVYWPGVTHPGAVCEEPVIGHDIYPTLLGMTGVRGDPTQNASMDGMDLTPVLADPSASLGREALHWLRYPVVFHYRKDARTKGPCGSIVQGDWKLMEFFETPHGLKQGFELYNIRQDVSEETNLAAQMPEKVEELKRAMDQWRLEVNAPAYDMAYETYRQIQDPK